MSHTKGLLFKQRVQEGYYETRFGEYCVDVAEIVRAATNGKNFDSITILPYHEISVKMVQHAIDAFTGKTEMDRVHGATMAAQIYSIYDIPEEIKLSSELTPLRTTMDLQDYIVRMCVEMDDVLVAGILEVMTTWTYNNVVGNN